MHRFQSAKSDVHVPIDPFYLVLVLSVQDGHPEVEKECRSLIKFIEEALGESIDSYLV